MSDKDAGGMYREVRYPRRFKSRGDDYMAGGYVEFATAESFGVWFPKTHCEGHRWNDRHKMTIKEAEETVDNGIWIETFDHHPQYEPEQVAFSELDRLRAENERLAKENDKLRSIDASKESQIGALHQRDRNTVDHLNDMIRRNDELSKRNETLQALLTEERERHAKTITETESERNELDDSICGKGGWRDRYDKIASDLDRERGRADAAIERCKELQSQADACYAAEQERDELAAKVQELQTKNDDSYDAFVQSRKAQPKLCEAQETTDLLHGAIGLCTEAGELLDAMKKVVFYGRQLDRTNAVEELGDVEFYLSLFRSALGVDRETIINANIAKLSKRYKERFTTEEAANRDTAAEAGIMQAVIGDKNPSEHERAERR